MATVGILLLAMGVGVLIGRSGNHSVASGPIAPQVIEVGGGAEGATASSEGAGATAGSAKVSGKKKNVKQLKAQAESQAGAEDVLKPAAGVKLPPAKAELGEKCEKGTAGCTDGEFTGNYFE